MGLRLNEEETLIACANIWNVIAHKGLHKDQAIELLWPKYVKMYSPCNMFKGDCPCCEFVPIDGVIGYKNCNKCPMLSIWGNTRSYCSCLYSEGSPYKAWTVNQLKEYAFTIRDGAIACLEAMWAKDGLDEIDGIDTVDRSFYEECE